MTANSPDQPGRPVDAATSALTHDGQDGSQSALDGLVVAIDGPSGSGKSSVSRELARRLGIAFLDTGAMYRALTWAALDRGTDRQDPAALTALAADGAWTRIRFRVAQ